MIFLDLAGILSVSLVLSLSILLKTSLLLALSAFKTNILDDLAVFNIKVSRIINGLGRFDQLV